MYVFCIIACNDLPTSCVRVYSTHVDNMFMWCLVMYGECVFRVGVFVCIYCYVLSGR